MKRLEHTNEEEELTEEQKELAVYDDELLNNILTHTQCVFHIIRLRLIIFHTPNFFNGDFHFNFFFINFFLCMYTMHEKWGQF